MKEEEVEEEEEEDLYGDVIRVNETKEEKGGNARADADAAAAAVSGKEEDAKLTQEEENGGRRGDVLQLTRKLAEAEEEIAKMRAERNILVKNMSCIFKTAREEIARKDAIIDDLRKKAFLSTGATPHQR